MNLLSLPNTWPFTTAFILIIFFAVIELVSVVLSASLSGLLDSMLPQIDGLEWLYVGRVPILVIFILWLMGFSLGGLLAQSMAHSATGTPFSTWLACVPATLTGLMSVRLFGRLLSKWIFANETRAVSGLSLIGRTAIVSEGLAKRGLYAQAKVRDEHGYLHYVLVEPKDDDDAFGEGVAVLLIEKVGAHYQCTRVTP